MTGALRRSIHAGIVMAALVVPAAAADVPRGLAFEESLDAAAVLAPAVPEGGLKQNVPVVSHVRVDLASVEGAGAAAVLARLDARVALYKARRIPVVIVLGALPLAEPDVDAWRRRVRIVVERERGAVAGYEFGAIGREAAPAVETYAFVLKQTAVLIRSIDADAIVAIGSFSSEPLNWIDWLVSLYGQGVAAYVDAISLWNDSDVDRVVSVKAVGAFLERQDPTAGLWYRGDRVGVPADVVVGQTLRHLGTRVTSMVFSAPPPAIQGAIAAASRYPDLFGGQLLALETTSLRWFERNADITVQGMSAQLLYSASSGDTYLVYARAAGATAQTVELETDTSMTTPAVLDPVTGSVEPITAPARERNRPVRLTVRLSGHPLVLDFNYGQAPYAMSVETRRPGLPPVEEVVAKHQQRQAAQDAAVRNYLAHLRIEMHFHLSPAEPAYNVVTENDLFAEGAATEWVEQSFSLNGATWTKNRPAFPILQPEKVLSLPLDLRLNQDYRYRLEGVDTVDGREAYAVKFDPVDGSRVLYRGTVWIDRATFARVKVSAIQNGTGGVVEANEEEQSFSKVGDAGGTDVWLLTRLTSRQTLLVAGRTVLNEREVRLTDVRLNAAEFESSRAAARESDRIMYRDTDRGVRYLIKKGPARVVSENLTASARAFAMGADIDPSLDFPLPIAGIDILDFNFLGRDLQLALLFGGVIAFGNVQRAGLAGGRMDVSVDFFGLALKSNDSVFDAAGEREAERVRTIPLSAGLNAGYRPGASHKVSGHIEVRHDSYSAATQTSAAFVVPSSTTTVGEGVGYEFRRRGYSLLASAVSYQRTSWTPWGWSGTFNPDTRTYLRYEAGLSKDFIFRTFHTVHLNGQYFGGRRLDRFSMYQFGLFDPARMHGVPSAVRFGEVAMLRASYSFNLFDQYRLDLFLDQAAGRPDRQSVWQGVTGLGAAVSLRGPRSTILRADVGRSLLPSAYRGAGSTVVQILILKPL